MRFRGLENAIATKIAEFPVLRFLQKTIFLIFQIKKMVFAGTRPSTAENQFLGFILNGINLRAKCLYRKWCMHQILYGLKKQSFEARELVKKRKGSFFDALSLSAHFFIWKMINIVFFCENVKLEPPLKSNFNMGSSSKFSKISTILVVTAFLRHLKRVCGTHPRCLVDCNFY